MKGINFKCIKPTSNSYQRRHNLVASPIGFLCGAPWKLAPYDMTEFLWALNAGCSRSEAMATSAATYEFSLGQMM